MDGVAQAVLEHVPRNTTVTVTSSPTRGADPTLELTKRLGHEGYRVVPHLAARLIADHAELAALLKRLDAMGVREAFVVAGDIPRATGRFEGAAELLAAMAEVGHGLERIGITGYPESHAFISDDATIQAMFNKVPFANYIVSQICFDAAVIARWIRRVRDRGVRCRFTSACPVRSTRSSCCGFQGASAWEIRRATCADTAAGWGGSSCRAPTAPSCYSGGLPPILRARTTQSPGSICSRSMK